MYHYHISEVIRSATIENKYASELKKKIVLSEDFLSSDSLKVLHTYLYNLHSRKIITRTSLGPL